MHSVLLELLYLAKHTMLVYFGLPILFGCPGSLLLHGLSLVAADCYSSCGADIVAVASLVAEHRL